MAGSSSRSGVPVSLILIHTNEGPNPPDVFPDMTAENLARWMDTKSVSYHKIVDDDSAVNYVGDNRASWSARSANSRSLNLCFTGFAHWSRQEWLAHPRMLARGADIVRHWCKTYSLPKVKLSPSQVGFNQEGIAGHVDWTLGKRDGSHTDPGKNFPWDIFIEMVLASVSGGIVIPIALPKTDSPDPNSPHHQWPTREECINLGFVKGWHGRLVLRLSVGHPGGYLYRAHVDYPGKPTKVVFWIDPMAKQSHDLQPAYRQEVEYIFDVSDAGPATLMITYAAPGGASLNLEWEK